jgi:purine-binding chemotaxis protein CheW
MLQQDTKPRTTDASIAAGGNAEYLAFRLGEEHYAIDILKVQEIRTYERPTAIANAPGFIKGVVNLRGTIVPIIDLRIKFDLQQAEYDSFTVVIILNVADRVVGVVVDAVSDVVALDGEQIRPTPEFSGSFDVRYIHGLANVDDRMLIVIDIETLIVASEMALAAQPLLQ